jgi:hypothetical protein
MQLFYNQTQIDAALELPAIAPGAFRFAKQFAPAYFVCSHCGEAIALPVYGMGTGYARDDKDGFICYACCGRADERELRATGRGVLYLTHDSMTAAYPYADGCLSNWPGSFRVKCRVKRGAHNIARYRYDVWFRFDGQEWHGVQYGDNAQLCRVKRLKTKTA